MRHTFPLFAMALMLVCSYTARAASVGTLVAEMDPLHDIPVFLTGSNYDANAGSYTATGITDGGSFNVEINFANLANPTGTLTIDGEPLSGGGIHSFTSNRLDIFDNTAYPNTISFRFFADANQWTPDNWYIVGFVYPDSLAADVGLSTQGVVTAVPAPAGLAGGLGLGAMLLAAKIRRNRKHR